VAEIVDELFVGVGEYRRSPRSDSLDHLLGPRRLGEPAGHAHTIRTAPSNIRRHRDGDLGQLGRQIRTCAPSLWAWSARPGLFTQTCAGGGIECRGPAATSSQTRRCASSSSLCSSLVPSRSAGHGDCRTRKYNSPARPRPLTFHERPSSVLVSISLIMTSRRKPAGYLPESLQPKRRAKCTAKPAATSIYH
jgi:hypothetical protein